MRAKIEMKDEGFFAVSPMTKINGTPLPAWVTHCLCVRLNLCASSLSVPCTHDWPYLCLRLHSRAPEGFIGRRRLQ